MLTEGLQFVSVYRAKRITGTELFYCKAVSESYDKTQGECGKRCESYVPKNGKNGCCKHRGYCYEPDGDRIVVTNSGKSFSIPRLIHEDSIIHNEESVCEVGENNKKIIILLTVIVVGLLLVGRYL